MKIISIIPLKKSVPRGDLTYFTNLNINIGNIVSVPIRNKETLALVTASEELKEEKSNIKKMNFHLKKVTKNKNRTPVIYSRFAQGGIWYIYNKKS